MTDAVEPKESNVSKLYDAFSKAQGEFPVIPKDSTVRVNSKEGKFLYEYKYADLTTIIAQTRPALVKHGLSFTQDYCIEKKGFFTQINHSSGASVKAGFIPCVVSNSDWKQVGSAYTYAKRISLTAALGISADEDLDAAQANAESGNTTSKSNPQKPQTYPQKKDIPNMAPQPKPTQAQLKRLYAIGADMHWPSESLRIYCVRRVGKTPGELSPKQYNDLCNWLESSPYDEQQVLEIDEIKSSLTAKELDILNKKINEEQALS